VACDDAGVEQNEKGLTGLLFGPLSDQVAGIQFVAGPCSSMSCFPLWVLVLRWREWFVHVCGLLEGSERRIYKKRLCSSLVCFCRM